MLATIEAALHQAGQNFMATPWLFLSMPLIAAVIGYVTKIAAVRMMFYPLEFIGIKPYLGWQGVIPRKAQKMASIAVDVITSKLITIEEIFIRLDPRQIAAEIEKPMLGAVEQITREVLSQHQPGLWEMLPNFVRDRLIKRVQAEALRRHLILLSCGVDGNVLRFLFPLTIEHAVFGEALGILSDALKAAARG